MEMDHMARANEIDQAVLDKLLSGAAQTGSQAEQMLLDERLDEVVQLATSSISDADFRNDPLIRLLFAHGSRGWEDSLL
jgi:hypothetical protein